jgi:hypothetical protein
MTNRKTNMAYRYATSIFLMLMLAWLTVSIPFVYAAQDIHHAKMIAAGDMADETADNPFANTNEEKTSGGSSTNFSEEYIHDYHSSEHFQTESANEYKIEHVATYIAFYGELLSPPPDRNC